jgi:PAS domain S-box-containing protein
MISDLIGKNQDQLQVLAFCEHGQMQSKFTYPIADTPCEMTLKIGEFICTEEFREKFPQLQSMQQWVGASSYHGIALLDSSKKIIGVMSIFDDKVLSLNPRSHSILKLFAARTAAELERYRVAKVRMENETRLHLALKAAHTGVWDWDLATGIISWSKEVAGILGFPLYMSQGSASILLQRIHPEDRPQVEQAIARAISEGTKYHIQYRIIHSSTGQIRWIACDANVVCELSDNDVRIMDTIADIFDRKQTESALIQSEANLRSIFDSSIQGIVIIDRGDKIQAFTPAASQIIQ